MGLTVSAAHGYSDVPGLLKWLDKYPYGCIEQTTSRAMPLLFFNDLADLAGLPRDQALQTAMQDAVDTVLDMQNFAGNFGMWGPGIDADPWIIAFALDFLDPGQGQGLCRAQRRAEARRELAAHKRRRRIPSTTPRAPMRSICWRAAAR